MNTWVPAAVSATMQLPCVPVSFSILNVVVAPLETSVVEAFFTLKAPPIVTSWAVVFTVKTVFVSLFTKRAVVDVAFTVKAPDTELDIVAVPIVREVKSPLEILLELSPNASEVLQNAQTPDATLQNDPGVTSPDPPPGPVWPA